MQTKGVKALGLKGQGVGRGVLMVSHEHHVNKPKVVLALVY